MKLASCKELRILKIAQSSELLTSSSKKITTQGLVTLAKSLPKLHEFNIKFLNLATVDENAVEEAVCANNPKLLVRKKSCFQLETRYE